MKIGFVFTNYNNSQLTRETVTSIARSGNGLNSVVVIVDNNSDAADVDRLREIERDVEGVTLVLNDQNVGYFPGLNVGIRYLRDRYADLDCIVAGNNDLLFPETFHEVVNDCRDLLSRYAVIAPDLVTLDGVHQNPHVIRGISPIRELIWDAYYTNYHLARLIGFLAQVTRKMTQRRDYLEYASARPIYQAYGACFILTPLFFKHFDLLWAPTFLMGEEFFLSHQVEEKKLQVYYEPRIVVIHHEHATVSKLPSRQFWSMSRASHKVYRKHVNPFRSRSRNPSVIYGDRDSTESA